MRKKVETKKLVTTAQDTLPIDELYENGMIKNRAIPGKKKRGKKSGGDIYSISFAIENTNYLLLRDSEKQKKLDSYIKALNSLPEDVSYQELLMNIPVETDHISAAMVPAIENPTPRQQAYLNIQHGFLTKLRDNNTDVRIIASLSYTPSSNLDQPYNILMQHYVKLSQALGELGAKTSVLTPEQRLEIIHDLCNPTDIGHFTLPTDLYHKGTGIKDYIAPSVFDFKATYTQMGDCVTRVFFVQGFAQTLDDEFLDELISNPFRINISKHIRLIDKAKAIAMVNKRLKALETDRQTRNKNNAKNNTNYIPYDLQKEIDACTDLLDRLGNNEELFDIGIYISVAAKNKEELDNITKTVKGVCQRHHINIMTASVRQEDAFDAVLPLASDYLNLTSYLLSCGVAILLPFSYDRLFSPDGLYYGTNLMSKLPIIFNRKENRNGNGFIFGQSGSGKSFDAKTEIEDVLHHSSTDRIMIIDPEAEFVTQCEAVGGAVITISADSTSYINPFDVSVTDKSEDIIKTKADLILSIFEVIKGEKLLGTEKSIIDRCVNLSYRDFILNNWDPAYLPTFQTFDEILQRQKDDAANDLHLYLEMYVTGSVNIFAHHTNVDTNARYIDFNLRDLGENLKKVGMLILLDFVWNRTIENFEKGVYTFLYADEFEMFYNDSSDNNSSGVFFEKVFARYRKYGGMATGITQNITNVLRSPTGLSMLQNAAYVKLFEQAPKNLAAVSDVYGLSDQQAAMLNASERGHGIIVMNGVVHPFEKVYPNNNLIYDSITTDFRDRIRKIKERENA